MSKTVKVAKLGSAVIELFLDDNATMEQAIAAAGLSADGFKVAVNGRTPCGTLANGDLITLTPAIKGGAEILVKVAKLGAQVKEVMLAEGSEVGDALNAADYEADGFLVRVNGRAEYGKLRSGDLVTLTPAIKGGCY
jgi:sulfur carrier protein ThiS